MLGYYRYILAMMVACSHLWSELIWWQGIYAVFGFYVISGYLMSLVINEVYSEKAMVWRYVANRFLRIYPVYWICFLLALLVLSLSNFTDTQTSEEMLKIPGALAAPEGLVGWVRNISLFGSIETRLTISQGWSLQVELVFYALMLVLSRRFWIVILWVLISIGICMFHDIQDWRFIDRYASVQGASLAFSLGALLYYLRQKIKLPSWTLWIFVGGFIIHFIFAYRIWGFNPQDFGAYGMIRKQHFGLYAHTVLSMLLLWGVLDAEARISQSSRFGRLGRKLGKMAYAIFLCHWVVGYLVMFTGLKMDNRALFIPVAFIGINLLALLLYQFIERPIDWKFRDKIRGRKIGA